MPVLKLQQIKESIIQLQKTTLDNLSGVVYPDGDVVVPQSDSVNEKGGTERPSFAYDVPYDPVAVGEGYRIKIYKVDTENNEELRITLDYVKELESDAGKTTVMRHFSGILGDVTDVNYTPPVEE